MRFLAPPVPPSLAIAEGATTPSASAGAVAWSTTVGGMVLFDGTAWRRLAASRLTPNTQTGTSYTLVASDARERMIDLANAGAITVTVPASVFGAGDLVTLLQAGAGQITVAPGSGMTARNPLTAKSRAQWSQLSIYFRSASEYVVGGDMAAT